MTLQLLLLATPVVSLLVGIVFVLVAIRVGSGWGIVDEPGPRKVHHKSVPRTGGIGISLTTLLVSGGVLAAASVVTPIAWTPWIGLTVMLVVMTAVGVFDDAVSLPGLYKLAGLIGVSVAGFGFGIVIDTVNFDPGGTTSLGMGLLGYPLTIAWICVVAVAIAFSDGLDGLAGGVGLIVSLTIAAVATLSKQYDITLVALALSGALGGFLYFNGPWGGAARVFMGDGGSMFLGVALATLPIILNGREGVGTMRAMIVPAAALGVPILDAVFTLIRRRFLQRRSLFAAEDGHVHHRLLAIGLSTRHAVLAIWGVTAAAACMALFAASFGKGWATLTILVPLLVLLWMFLFRTAGSVRGRETIAAVRRHRASGRRGKTYRRAFEEAQLRLAKTGNFEEWWKEICHAGELLHFASLDLRGSRRDGDGYEISWVGSEDDRADEETGDTLDVTLDVPQRRTGSDSPLKLHARIFVKRSQDARGFADLESAGHRVTFFNRLLTEHGLATLDDEDRTRLAKAHRLRQALRPRAPADTLDTPPMPERDDGLPTVAIVHDFLYTRGGAEKVLEEMLEIFPHADLFSVIDFVPPGERSWLRDKPVTTTFIQNLPLAGIKHRAYLPLMPLAIEQLDVGGYDVVLSSSYCVAKGIICRPDQLHVSYCHSPVRYAWDLQHQYLRESGLSKTNRRRGPIKLLKNALARSILHYIRGWDFRSAAGVDVFLSNSDFVGRRIEKAYRRTSTTVYPPVDVSAFTLCDEKQSYYYTSSRHVPYKRMPMIVEAFSRTPDRRLVIGGDGPDFEKVKALAGPNVRVVGHQKHEEHIHYMQRAKAFVFAAEEDFGIVPVEAMACGTPVIAYGRGGTTETVVDGVTGVHFKRQTCESLLEAVERFEALDAEGVWDPDQISRHAHQFGAARFREELRDIVLSHWSLRTGRSDGASINRNVKQTSREELPQAMQVEDDARR